MLPGKARRFFLEMVHAVSFETVCAAAGCSVVLSQQHRSELTFTGYRPIRLFGIRGGNKSHSPETPICFE